MLPISPKSKAQNKAEGSISTSIYNTKMSMILTFIVFMEILQAKLTMQTTKTNQNVNHKWRKSINKPKAFHHYSSI